jgi:hypothetical protein
VALRTELAARGLDEADLAASWGLSTERPAREWRSALTAETRRRLVFESDTSAHGAAKRASDGWEHGFLAFDEVRALAAKSRHETARHIRRSILRLGGLDDEASVAFVSSKYESPAEYFPYARYVKGWLLGDTDDPAPEGGAYPALDWRYRLQRFARVTDDGYSVGFEDTFTPRIADSVTFHPSTIEVWGPGPAPTSET